jgi:hypothetical protein
LIIFAPLISRTVSHSRLRNETNCLNCDAVVDGRYCKACGQENVEPKQSLWHLLTHFFNDITHFDGKFFATIKQLILHPGFLSAEYVKGRRMKYLDPIRMYLFISALFALAYIGSHSQPKYVSVSRDKAYKQLFDSVAKSQLTDNFHFYNDTVQGKKITIINFPKEVRIPVEEYERQQKALPDEEQDDWLSRYITVNTIRSYEVYQDDPYNFMAKFQGNFLKSLSKIFFISLPVFAALLSLLYVRRRKTFYFVSHAIFAIHFYCVIFLLQTFNVLCGKIPGIPQNVDSFISLVIFLGLFVYLFVAMKKFYKQGIFKTFIKFFLLSFAMSIVLLALVSVLFFNSVFTIAH